MTFAHLDDAARKDMANAIRALSMDAVEKAKSGHPGLPMGAADIVTALFAGPIKYDASQPNWPDRDRFVLSAGHGSMLLYSLLHLLGVPGVGRDDLRNFRQLGSNTPGHPEYGHTPGVETTTGPLGQGLATAVGMALAERMLAAEFGDDLVDHRTYVLASDGDLMEGVSQEAIAIAGHLKLNKLIVLFDDNGITIDGPISVADSVDQLKRFEAAGWRATRVDGHDQRAVAKALDEARAGDRPTLIACKTVIGFGAPTRAGKSKAHGEPLGADEIKGARETLGWSHAAFEIPDHVAAAWATAGRRAAAARLDWEARLAAAPAERRAEFERRLRGDLPKNLAEVVAAARARLVAEAPEMATRKSSEAAIKVLAPAVPELVTGSADLTGSNNTKVESTPSLSPASFKGRFVHWGIREHGMAAALNGMALHGGFIPSGATFLVFADYCRPALRLAALMRQRVVHVMTHDSIGLGEDGPTHQPVEHLASLRCIPNMLTMRPADAVEALECWQMALENRTGPSVLALTRQNLPALRRVDSGENLSARGAYEIAPAQGEAQVSLFASGSEVSVALAAQKLLADKGVAARVVSVPSIERFLAQDAAYKARVLGAARVRIGVEAAIRMGWDAVIGSDGGFVGMTDFGASGPAKALFEHFGVTPQKVAALAQEMLAR